MYQSPRRTASPKTTNVSKPIVSPRRWVEEDEDKDDPRRRRGDGGTNVPPDNDLEQHRQVFLVYSNATKNSPPPPRSPSASKNKNNNKKDSPTTIHKKNHPSEAIWSHPFPPTTSSTMGNPMQVWAYEEHQTPESLKRMKQQQTHPIGVWGTTTTTTTTNKSLVVVFVPPHQTPPSSFTPRGIWTFPLIPRKEHLLAEDQAGFLKVGDYVSKEDPLDVSGTWRLLCHRPGGDDDDDEGPTSPTPKSPLSKSVRSSPSSHKSPTPTMTPTRSIRIHVRDNTGGPASNNNNNPLITLKMKPTVDTIGDIKTKLYDKTGIPPGDQRLSRPLLDHPPTKKKTGTPPTTPTPQQLLLLNDAPTLREAGIQDGDILSLDPMEIYVQEERRSSPSQKKGPTYTLCPVQPNQTIAEIKRQLIEHHLPFLSGTNSPNQQGNKIQLTFQSIPCVDDKTLQQHGIQHQSTLILEEEPRTPMIVYVKVVPPSPQPQKGRGTPAAAPVMIPMEVEPTDTIGSLQEKIEDMKDIPVDDQRLFFRNKPLLEPQATLDDEDIHHGDVLDLVLPTPMIIHVRTPHGKKISLEVEPTDTILSVKEQVEDSEDIPLEEQRMRFDDEELKDDHATLDDLGIEDGDTIDMDPMHIIIKDWTGKKFRVGCEPHDTIDTIKDRIEKQEGHPKPIQYLIKDGDILDDPDTLQDCGIKHKDVIDLDRMKIYVKDWKGKTFPLEVDPDEPIDDVKKMIEIQEGHPVPQQVLKFKNKTLKEPKSLDDYGVQYADLVDLSKGMPTAATSPTPHSPSIYTVQLTPYKSPFEQTYVSPKPKHEGIRANTKVAYQKRWHTDLESEHAELAQLGLQKPLKPAKSP